ncbi:DUF4236 domain-containing protein [Streptomyces sp. NBC_01092]|uniref:DUF4236 domain-containing protein n=1 Tax=Streptomyces sp. NBC_01092 TaxID=2903748 RepID=UPI0038665008|nr:DUF4236 domain-containing protein [Streptomyces sp. NBC_01092]
MAVTFRKRIRVLPGVYLNLGRRSVSVTVKAGPLARTWSTNGRTTTSADLPGPLGYRRTTRRRRQP